MGLTSDSTGRKSVGNELPIKKNSDNEKVIALAGNPNVGKSTVFNALTGMNQHTGNWAGKTVTNASGHFSTENGSYLLVDIPGTYSLMAHSAEEEIARNFICFGGADMVVVVCDATCLERNLNLVLQTLEVTGNCVVCVNLMDEARKKCISIDLDKISERLGVPVISTIARKKKSLSSLISAIEAAALKKEGRKPFKISYISQIEQALSLLEPAVSRAVKGRLPARWLSLRLLDGDNSLKAEIRKYIGFDIEEIPEVKSAVGKASEMLGSCGIGSEELKDMIAASVVLTAEDICIDAIETKCRPYDGIDRKLDRIFTSKATGFPVMILLLMIIFWITVTGANYPSALLSDLFSQLGKWLEELFISMGAPEWLKGIVLDGAYRVLSWVVSVMLPPMAIFFPLFTLLEDSGYLPRIAYNLDKPFKKCSACGKQALTLCMGLGCNAAGVVGCRIIDSPRERLIAVLTNAFAPCNGRFPAIITLSVIFFAGAAAGFGGSVISAAAITLVIILGVGATLIVSNILSKTLLKGIPSSFTLELPPYRKPQLGKVIIRSIFDRTIFVLGRAAAVAAPAGAVIWLLANIYIGDTSVLSYCTEFLDPFGRLIGLDGVILTAFILGLPANEIVLPIVIMTYMNSGTLTETESLTELFGILSANGWTAVTAVCFIIFSLMHWPCSTTLMTIKKETGSLKWTAAAFLIPTAAGIICCLLVNLIAGLIIG